MRSVDTNNGCERHKTGHIRRAGVNHRRFGREMLALAKEWIRMRYEGGLKNGEYSR